MLWMFSESNRGAKRKFLTFTECTINGPWDLADTYITSSQVTRVFRALNENTCEIEITTPNGDKFQLRFRNGGLASIEQSMLLYREDDITLRKKL